MGIIVLEFALALGAGELPERKVAIMNLSGLGLDNKLIAAFKLVAPDKIVGTLKVDIEVPGVTVEIDGKEIGTTPLAEPAVSLPPGAHVIVLRRPGFREFQREFEIEAFETSRLELQLELQKRE